MRYMILALAILLGTVVSSQAQAQTQTQFSISIGNPGASIGFQMSTYPRLVRIPGYPVYYDPWVDTNYFFYDGLYWVFHLDNWYSSSWYDGPWDRVPPAYVPLFVLRIPVRYYRHPPAYFRGWRRDAAPRWGEHWGRNWERQRSGWNRWDRRSVPAAAPLPTYQRNYTGNRYPHQLEQQRSIESRSYRYQPREAVSRQILQQRRQHVEARERERDRQQQQQRNRQQQDLRQQQQQRERRQQDLRQQQQQRERRQQDLRQQQQQQRSRQQQEVQRQQQQRARQQQDVQKQQQQRSRQQREVQQQQQRVQQQRSQPDQKARGNDNKGNKGRSDKNKDQKDNNRAGGGRP